MKHCFLITSAINTRFGTFDTEKRMDQTIQTFNSIKSKLPDAKIILVESSAISLTEEQIDVIKNHVQWLVNLSGDPSLKNLFDGTENWDIVKNMSELVAFNTALKMLDDQNLLDDVDRIHKLSGRYTLNHNFNPIIYERFTDKIILPMRYRSQFTDPREQMDVPFQYMSRLWSWPKVHHEVIKTFYRNAIQEFIDRCKALKRMDMEHLLYLLLPPELIKEVPFVGVRGQLGQNGNRVEN